MRYIVVLDPSSDAGKAYLAGNNDGTTKEGLPFIDCSEIDPNGPYLACTRGPKSRGGSDQSLWIPHRAVAYVVGYAKQEDRPVGFRPVP